jgi:hypothetical protein
LGLIDPRKNKVIFHFKSGDIGHINIERVEGDKPSDIPMNCKGLKSQKDYQKKETYQF